MEIKTEKLWIRTLFVLLYLPVFAGSLRSLVRGLPAVLCVMSALEAGCLLRLMICMGMEDIQKKRIRTELTARIACTAFLLQISHMLLNGEHVFLPVIQGAGTGGILTLAVYLLSRGKGIGGGDVRLVIAAGILLGPEGVTRAVWVACWLAAPEALYGLIRRRREHRGHAFPFGPYLAVGIWAVFLKTGSSWLQTSGI